MACYICEECDRKYYDGDPLLYERNNSGDFICECGGILHECEDTDDDGTYDPFEDGDPLGDMGGPNGLHEDEEGNLTYD